MPQQQQQWMQNPEMQGQDMQWNPMFQSQFLNSFNLIKVPMFPPYPQQFQQQKKGGHGDFFVRKSKEEQQLESQQYQQMFDPSSGFYPAPFMGMPGMGMQMQMPGMPFGFFPMMPPMVPQQFQEDIETNHQDNQQIEEKQQKQVEQQQQQQKDTQQQEQKQEEQKKEEKEKKDKEQKEEINESKEKPKQQQQPQKKKYKQQQQRQQKQDQTTRYQPKQKQSQQQQQQQQDQNKSKPSRFRIDSDTFPSLPGEAKQTVVYKKKEVKEDKKSGKKDAKPKEEKKVESKAEAKKQDKKQEQESLKVKLSYSTEQIKKYFNQLKNANQIKIDEQIGKIELKDIPIIEKKGLIQLEIIEPSKITIRAEEKFEFKDFKPSKKKDPFDKSKIISRHKYSLQLPVYERKEQK